MHLRLVLLVAAATSAVTSARPLPSVHRDVHRRLVASETVDIVVEMHTDATSRRLIEAVDALSFDSRAKKIEYVVDTLQAAANKSQHEIDALLSREATTATPLFQSQYKSWSRNARYFNGATFELVEALASLSSVASIREAEVGTVELPSDSVAEDVVGATELHVAGSIEWGISRVQAPEAWANGITGEGVVIANLDTGVHYTHNVLRNSMREDYNWFDPVNGTALPNDSHGHGTHTMGTLVGSDGVGVAPGSKWIACLGCPNGACPEADVMACGEWFICPKDSQGANRDCSKAPHVINNSWSERADKKTYVALIDAWYAAGIIPVFANGNRGYLCNTARSPGNAANVIAVGATTVNNTLASFSSKGPNAYETSVVKPDISAPGQDVVSASHRADNEYTTMSGTSMSTPHVTGVIALLLSQNRTLTYDQVRSLITTTALRDVLKPNVLATPVGWYTGVCGNTTDNDWPNNQYGYGLVNALDATTKLSSVSA